MKATFASFLLLAALGMAESASLRANKLSEHEHQQQRGLVGNSCCSFDYETCGDSDWCSAAENNCADTCGGKWVDFTKPQPIMSHCCSWDGENCPHDSAWCDHSQSNCEGSCQASFIHAYCCSWDGKNCGDDIWCNTSDQNCAVCNGKFIDTDIASTSCSARWSWCQDSSTCCEDMVCVQYDDYTGCGYEGQDGAPIGGGGTTTPEPTEPPSPEPTPKPTNKPTEKPSSSPTKSPTNKPTEKPSSSPSKSPTNKPTEKPSSSPSKSPTTSPVQPTPSPVSPTPGPVPPTTSPITPTTGPVQPPTSPTESPVVAESSPCCSFDYEVCTDSTSWCTESEENCNQCSGGKWIDFSQPQPVMPRCCSWDGTNCPHDSPWCDDSQSNCEGTCQGSFIHAYCCSWDGKNCGDDEWCNASDQNCAVCTGNFIGTDIASTSCTARWSWCSDSSTCCGDMVCVQYDDYTGCGYEGVDGTPIGGVTTNPTASPVSSSPTMAPVSSPTLSPVVSPTTSPVEPTVVITPTETPVQPTTQAPVPSPPEGSFIASGYSEFITIPQPPVPSISGPTTSNCPHEDIELVDWSFTPSQDGQDVNIPENTRVIIRSSVTRPLGTLTIPASSELILGSSLDGIEITMGGMVIQGRLTAGSETCLMETPITLTFTGERPSDAVRNPPAPQVKGIDVDGGILSLHGKRFYRTWTRLSLTAEVGDTTLYLQDSVNWEVNQELVLVTTAMKDARDWHENEVLTISEIIPTSQTGAAVRVSTPVQNRHIASNNYQAEVGLLTRTIKIQGSAADSEPTDPDNGNCAREDRIWAQYGDPSQPCMNRELTGYGAHVMVRNNGKGYVEGVELFRVGQTNVLGRYPMHWHLLGDCEDCYFRASSVHRSYYRCISIHATNRGTVTENVAYDVTGYCYYFEDGVETDNTMSFNLAAHIHMIGPEIPNGGGQTTPIYKESDSLTLPADVTAAGFYITNVHNNIIGNAASGGWAGFAFPNLPTPLGPSRNINIRPSSATSLTIDGNHAHSSAWWWYHTGGFYFGGALYYDSNNDLTYNPGRSFDFGNHNRDTCAASGGYCQPKDRLWIRMTNSKAYLNAGVGLNSWSGRMELLGFESHDNGLAVESLSDGFWIDNMLSVCRSGEPVSIPSAASITSVPGNGFTWYDTAQAHIITDSTFRNCGYRSDEWNQYDTSPDRGCGDDADIGCSSSSSVWGFLTHSDEFNPELMQGTRGITMENNGRRFILRDFRNDNDPGTVSGRTQNWLDVDGSISELGTPTLIGSGLIEAQPWWAVDDNVVQDPQGPLVFIPQNDGPERSLAHIHMEWDQSLFNQVGGSICGNGSGVNCPTVGVLRHRGPRFTNGMPVKPPGDFAGPTGGFGWYMELANGRNPVQLRMSLIEVDPSIPLLFSIAYPSGTGVSVEYEAGWCTPSSNRNCIETFSQVSTIEEVRTGLGNTYHYSNGVLTIRVIMTAQSNLGTPDWVLPDWNDISEPWRGYSLDRFERDGVFLPIMAYGPELRITADCASSDGVYCNQSINTAAARSIVDNVCDAGMQQVSYDRCCDSTRCVYANGSEEVLP